MSLVRLGCLVVERRRVCYVAKTFGGECDSKTLLLKGGGGKSGHSYPQRGEVRVASGS